MKALISVFDKTNIADFAGKLQEIGYEIISTGGTCNILKDVGIDVIQVSEFTGSPEILGGRVKTLHPKIFAGILARADQEGELKEHDIPRIDIVCCNLYPFQETVKKSNDESEILEHIDIGGVTLLRAAAKNYKDVLVIVDPDDYADVFSELSSGDISMEDRKKYALKAFSVTARYDKAISEYFSGNDTESEINIRLDKVMDLRYGENAHQKAAFYGKMPFVKIQGEKELSFNNIQDANAAVNIARNLTEPAAVIIKHAVPCGAAVSVTIHEAFIKALQADSLSAFGGIVGLNRRMDKDIAEEIIKSFFEVVAAPEFSGESLEVLRQKKNLRVVQYDKFEDVKDFRNISGGLLVQDPDTFEGEDWKVVTKKLPSEKEMSDLRLAWKIVRFLKSNAIAIVKNGQTHGLGSGETSRVGAVNVAISKVKQFFGENLNGMVMASDAFFPFPDSIEEAARANICAIVQPGGSRNDETVIKRADELGISMVFTGRRHFLH